MLPKKSPTTDCDDCGYCEYQPVCRASTGDYATTSPRAEWAKRNAADIPAYAMGGHR